MGQFTVATAAVSAAARAAEPAATAVVVVVVVAVALCTIYILLKPAYRTWVKLCITSTTSRQDLIRNIASKTTSSLLLLLQLPQLLLPQLLLPQLLLPQLLLPLQLHLTSVAEPQFVVTRGHKDIEGKL